MILVTNFFGKSILRTKSTFRLRFHLVYFLALSQSLEWLLFDEHSKYDFQSSITNLCFHFISLLLNIASVFSEKDRFEQNIYNKK